MIRRFATRMLAALTATILLGYAPRVSSVLIPCLSGFVRTGDRSPVAEADLDFIIPETGEKLITPGDNTDATGFYNVCVLPGVYDVTFAPPPGTTLLGKVFSGVDLTANVGKELNVSLEQGLVVAGTVTTSSTALGVAGVDIDADFVSGSRVFTPGDNTDASGAYRIVVPAGVFRFRYEPPVGSRLRGVEVDSVTVEADQTIRVRLDEGFLLSGRVRDDTGQQLPGVSVDLRDFLTGEKIFVANNETDAAGDYAVAVPQGTFELRYVPARGLPYVAVALENLLVTGDLRNDQVLQRGHRVAIVVRDFMGASVPSADIDVKETITQVKVFTPYDRADAQGRTEAVLITDTYDFRVDPPIGTALDRVETLGVAVRADTTITVELPEVVRRRVTARVTDPLDAGIPGVVVEARLIPSARPVYIPSPASDASGNLDLSIPVGRYDVFFIPPFGSRTVADKIKNVTVANDSTWGTIILQTGVVAAITVTGNDGRRLEGADIDVLRGAAGTAVFVPYDETDAAGRTRVALVPDVYSIVVTPLPGSGYSGTTAGPAFISSDTSIAITLQNTGSTKPPIVSLGPPVPNPFRERTRLSYDVGPTTDARIDIYDVTGRLVRRLIRQESVTGGLETVWDGTDDRGRKVPSGVYFLRLQTAIANASRKVMVIR